MTEPSNYKEYDELECFECNGKNGHHQTMPDGEPCPTLN